VYGSLDISEKALRRSRCRTCKRTAVPAMLVLQRFLDGLDAERSQRILPVPLLGSLYDRSLRNQPRIETTAPPREVARSR
jgi:hypothetical protein